MNTTLRAMYFVSLAAGSAFQYTKDGAVFYKETSQRAYRYAPDMETKQYIDYTAPETVVLIK